MYKTNWKYRNSDCAPQWEKKKNGLNLEEISSLMALSLIFYLQSKQQHKQEYVQLYQFRPKKISYDLDFWKVPVLQGSHSLESTAQLHWRVLLVCNRTIKPAAAGVWSHSRP